jgi:predicted nuclease of predicted toxin-antitoxin system
MKLLFDQNLSNRLPQRRATEYPGSVHVADVGLSSGDDQDVWDYAKQNGFAIVSKDSDFQSRSLLYGHPPKVIWLRIGNGPTPAIVSLLQSKLTDVEAFDADSTLSLLVLS